MPGFDDRREHLLATAAKVFAARGYAATSMRDLARSARMSLAGIYYYVSAKEELLFQIQKSCFEGVIAGARDAVSAERSAEGRLGAFISHHVTFFASHMAEMKVLAHEAESLSGPMLEEIRGLKRAYVNHCVELLADLDGGAGAEGQRHVAAYTLFGMMNWIYTWYSPDGQLAASELADSMTRLFLNGYHTEVPAT
jgi:AcrR family transcriptional regulator